MKKYLAAFSWFIFALFLCLPSISFAQQWIQDLEAQHIGTRDLDASGNMSLKGSMRWIPNVDSYANLRATNTISPYGKSFLVINGTGTIDMSSTPTISTTGAVNGQQLLIMGGAHPVTFFDEGTLTGSLLELGASSRALSTGSWLELVYYSGKWYERFNPDYNLDQSLKTTDSPTFADVTTTDDIDVGDDIRVVGAASVTETLSVTGNSYLGAAGYISTNTAATGAWDFPGAVSIAGAVTGPTSVTATKLVASGAGSVGLYSRSKSQILALTPAAAGQAYYCNDCTAVTVCVSTGTGVGAFTKVDDRTAACD